MYFHLLPSLPFAMTCNIFIGSGEKDADVFADHSSIPVATQKCMSIRDMQKDVWSQKLEITQMYINGRIYCYLLYTAALVIKQNPLQQ